MSSTTVPTEEQIDALLDFFSTSKDLALKNKRGVTAPLWKELAAKLNAMEGCTKNVTQWQRVWNVRKLQTRRSITKLRQHKAGRLKSAPPPLAKWKQKLAAVMGYDVEDDKAKALARAASIIKTSAVTSTESQDSEMEDVEDEEYEESEDNEEDEEGQDVDDEFEDNEESALDGDSNESRQGNAEDEILQESRLQEMESVGVQEQQQSNQSIPQQEAPKVCALISEDLPRKRRRRGPSATAPYSIQERLFRIEERRQENDLRRNEELAGIRMALVDLCRLVRQLIECHYEQ